MQDIVNEVLKFLGSIPDLLWQSLAASIVISPAFQSVKHWFEMQNEKVILGIVTLIGTLVSFAAYFADSHPGNPWLVALRTAVIGFTNLPVYYLAVKPIYKKLTAANDAANTYVAQASSAIVPAGGIPEPIVTAALPPQGDQFDH